MYTFNAVETKDRLVEWIRDFFEKNGKGCNAVVGISGGKINGRNKISVKGNQAILL